MKLKKLYIASILLLTVATVFAQEKKVEFKEAQDDNWLVDIDEAYKISKKTDRPILANFTGSDWCGWCKKLRAEVFNKPEFKKWAEENVVLLELDFPRRTKLPAQQMDQNRGLQQAFQVRGFPTIWVFSLDKPDEAKNYAITAYGKTGYLSGGASNFTKEVDKMISRKTASK